MAGGRGTPRSRRLDRSSPGRPDSGGVLLAPRRRRTAAVGRPPPVPGLVLARDVLEVLTDAGLDRAALSGHSLGVQIIVEACRVDPDRVAALMPVAGTFENPVKTFADLAILDRIYPLADVLLGLFPFAFLKPFNKGIANPETGLKMVRLIRVAGPKVTAEGIAPHLRQLIELDFSVLFKMMGQQRKHSTADFLPTITTPTLILAGRSDLFTPPSVQQKMADLIPDSEIVWFSDGGHMLPIEEPEGIVAAMQDFMDRRVDTPAERVQEA